MNKLPKKINVDRLAVLLNAEVTSSFLFEMTQHLIDQSFKGYISKSNILAIESSADLKWSHRIEAYDYEQTDYVSLMNYCFNEGDTLKDHLRYENDSLLISSFLYFGQVWSSCIGIDINPYEESDDYADAIHSPLKVPFSEISFDTQGVITFFDLEIGDESVNRQDSKKLNITSELDYGHGLGVANDNAEKKYGITEHNKTQSQRVQDSVEKVKNRHEEILKEYPFWKITRICDKLAKEFKVSPSTIRNRLNE